MTSADTPYCFQILMGYIRKWAPVADVKLIPEVTSLTQIFWRWRVILHNMERAAW